MNVVQDMYVTPDGDPNQESITPAELNTGNFDDDGEDEYDDMYPPKEPQQENERFKKSRDFD